MDTKRRKVFDILAYDNTARRFDGYSSAGNKLPQGTYFYQLDYSDSDGRQHKSGYLILKY